MNKLIALLSTVCFVFALTGVNAWAADPEPQTPVIDRHAVWTKIIEDNTKKGTESSSDNQSAQTSSEDHEKQSKMEVRMKDLPWQKIG